MVFHPEPSRAGESLELAPPDIRYRVCRDELDVDVVDMARCEALAVGDLEQQQVLRVETHEIRAGKVHGVAVDAGHGQAEWVILAIVEPGSHSGNDAVYHVEIGLRILIQVAHLVSEAQFVVHVPFSGVFGREAAQRPVVSVLGPHQVFHADSYHHGVVRLQLRRVDDECLLVDRSLGDPLCPAGELDPVGDEIHPLFHVSEPQVVEAVQPDVVSVGEIGVARGVEGSVHRAATALTNRYILIAESAVEQPPDDSIDVSAVRDDPRLPRRRYGHVRLDEDLPLRYVETDPRQQSVAGVRHDLRPGLISLHLGLPHIHRGI